MPQQQQSGGMPAFNWLGLLAGGRGYAGQYFALKDRVAAEEALRQQHFQEQGQAAQGLLASPQYQQFLKNPYDRNAAFQLWSASQGGPAADVGNNILSQAGQAVYGREATTFQNELQRQSQAAQNAFSHGERIAGQQFEAGQTERRAVLGLESQTHATDETLRANQIEAERQLAQQKAIADSLPAQAALNYKYDQLYKDRGSDDIVLVNDGFMKRPGLTSVEGQKIMAEGQSMGGVADIFQRLNTMLDDPRQMDVQEWNALATNAIPLVQHMNASGTYDAGLAELVEKILPSMPPSTIRGKPDLQGYVREKLRRGAQILDKRMSDLSTRTLYPVSAFRTNRLYDPSRLPPPPETSPLEATKGAQKRIEDLRGSPGESRVRTAPEYKLPDRRGKFAPALQYDPEKQRKLRSR